MSNRETELGTLIVVILKARNLNDKHSFYKQDVFAQVTLNGVTKRTAVAVKGGQHPEWDEEVRFPVMKDSTDKSRKLNVACFAKEPRSDDILGKGEVDIADTLKTGEFDEWVPLNVDGVVRGDLYLEMTFYSNAPVATNSLAPPSSNGYLQRRPSKLSPSERLGKPSQTHPAQTASHTIPSRPLNSGTHGSGQHHSVPQSRPQHSAAHLPNPAAQSAALHNLLSDNPPANQRPLNNAYQGHHHPGHHLASSSSSRSSSSSPIRRSESPLPPLPQEAPATTAPLPSTLLPGGGRSRPHQNTLHVSSQVPSTLRAGAGRAVSQPISPSYHPAHSRNSSLESSGHAQHPSSEYFSVPGPGSRPYATTTSPAPHNTLITGNTPPISGPAQYLPQSSSIAAPTQTYSHTPPITTWNSEQTPAGPISFPVPMPYTPAPGEISSQISYSPSPAQTPYTPPPSQAAFGGPLLQTSYPTHLPETLPYQQPPVSNDYPDPYLQARYQTPLPLPRGSESPSLGKKSPHASTPAVSNHDAARIEALRHIETEAERRKAQEEKDLALALALDRELNLNSESGPTPTARTTSAMPGGW